MPWPSEPTNTTEVATSATQLSTGDHDLFSYSEKMQPSSSPSAANSIHITSILTVIIHTLLLTL